MPEILDAIYQQKKIEAGESPMESAKGDIKNFFGELSRVGQGGKLKHEQ